MKTNPDDLLNAQQKLSLEGNGIVSSGLTKREYFAAQALAGLSVQAIAGTHNNWAVQSNVDSIAKYAVLAADALIKELNK